VSRPRPNGVVREPADFRTCPEPAAARRRTTLGSWRRRRTPVPSIHREECCSLGVPSPRSSPPRLGRTCIRRRVVGGVAAAQPRVAAWNISNWTAPIASPTCRPRCTAHSTDGACPRT
jgi:hypothetical protein